MCFFPLVIQYTIEETSESNFFFVYLAYRIYTIGCSCSISLLFFVIFLCCVKCLSNFPGAVLTVVLCVVFKLRALARELLQRYQNGDASEWKESRASETNWCSKL